MIYVSDHPFKLTNGQERFHLWGDEPGEAMAAVYAVGGDPDLARRHFTWEAYAVTVEQFAELIGLGVRVTDKWGPAEFCARRDGRTHMLAMIERVRARGCA